MSEITVIIPCFNHASYLDQALDSVLAQTLQPVQILVVDDGSTDATPEIAARFSPRVGYFCQENRGLAAARNTGIRHARGDLLAFLDADDLWLPDFLEKLTSILSENASLGAVYGGCQFVDQHSKPLPQKAMRVVPPDRVHAALLDGAFFPVHTVLVRRACFDEIGFFDESLRAAEDWDMWLRLSAVYPMAGTPQIIAQYRMHGDNMTRDLQRMYLNEIAVVDKHFGSAEGDSTTWLLEKQRAYAAVYLRRVLAHYQRHEISDAHKYLSLALATSPSMAKRLDAFYALGCADQPLGQMGDLQGLDLEQTIRRVRNGLSATFDAVEVMPPLREVRGTAYGTAYFALGLLAYNGGHLDIARIWLARAIRYRPNLVLEKQWSTTFAKSLLGNRVRNLKRKWAHA